jgi:drug/metabolite transporter (DMT)-like permease
MIASMLGAIFAVAALIMFSANTLLTKIASARLSLDLGFLISVTANLLFCILLLALEFVFLPPKELHWNAHGFFLFFLSGVFSTYLGRWFFYEAVVRFGPAKSSIFQVCSPGFTVILAWIMLDEGLSAIALGGIALAICGLLLVVYVPGIFSSQSPRSISTSSQVHSHASPRSLSAWAMQSSIFLGLGSALAYAIGNVLRASAVRSWNEPIIGALLGAISGLVLHAVFSTSTADLFSKIKAADRKGMLIYGISGILGISAQICAIASMRYIPVSISNLITLCSPLLVIPGSYFFLKNREGITLRTWLGGALTIIGIAIIIVIR